MPNYPIYPQNYPQYPVYPQYQPVQPPVQYTQPMMGQQPQTPQQPAQTAPQMPMSSSIVNVRSESEAINWPVAPNNSVTFVDELNGYLYTKTSFNQFDRPQFVKYKLVREDAAEAPVNGANGQQGNDTPYALKDDLTALAGAVKGVNESVSAINNTVASMKGEMEKMSGDLYGLAGKKKAPARKTQEVEDDG